MHVVKTLDSSTGSLAGRLMAQLDAWPAVRAGRAGCGVGTGFAPVRRADAQIVHLHGGDEAELHLTRPVVARLGDVLLKSGRVAVDPGGDWVRVRLDTESDVALVMSLASVALKANGSGDPSGRADAIPPCHTGRTG
jgi:luciferase-like monooxygenase